jgi:DinB superfamily
MYDMTRSQIDPLPTYFDRYINVNDDVDVLTALNTGLSELEHAPLDDWKRIGDRVYAPGKWTVKDILQHVIDTERVFSYRATSFARGEADVKGYDEETYGRNALAQRRTLEDLLDEARALRRSTIQQFQSFSPEMLQCQGNGFKGPFSVIDIGFILAGHQRWHFGIIHERYGSLAM